MLIITAALSIRGWALFQMSTFLSSCSCVHVFESLAPWLLGRHAIYADAHFCFLYAPLLAQLRADLDQPGPTWPELWNFQLSMAQTNSRWSGTEDRRALLFPLRCILPVKGLSPDESLLW